MNVASIAIVAYLPQRTPDPLSDVGGVDTMIITLAFGHASNL